MFGWLKAEASVASLMNISTRSGRPASWGSIVLITIRFSKPRTPFSFARHTSAIPPVASFESISYLLKCVPACHVEVRPRVSGSPSPVEPVTLVDVVMRTPSNRGSLAIKTPFHLSRTRPLVRDSNGAPMKNLTAASRTAGQLAFHCLSAEASARLPWGGPAGILSDGVVAPRAVFDRDLHAPRARLPLDAAAAGVGGRLEPRPRDRRVGAGGGLSAPACGARRSFGAGLGDAGALLGVRGGDAPARRLADLGAALLAG